MTEEAAKEQELRRRLAILFKSDNAMVDAYVAQFGCEINMKNIQAIREQFPGSPGASASPTGAQPILEPTQPAPTNEPPPRPAYTELALQQPVFDAKLESPIYEVLVDCPVCKLWSLKSYELKAKSLTVVNDPYMAPVFESTGKFQPLNFLTASITVCTRCLFASPDRKDFIQYNKLRRQTDPSQIIPSVITALSESTAERQALRDSTGIGDELFKVPRNLAAAALSYQLADLRAAAEVKGKIQGAWFKRGSYWVRIALLRRQAGMDDTDALRTATEHYKMAFMHSDFPTQALEFQTLYVLFTIHLRLGDAKVARDYLAILDKTRQDMEKSSVVEPGTINILKKWIDQGRNRWDDREDPRVWKTPGL